MKMNDSSAGLDRTLLALAHPTRRAILHRVMTREQRVTDLARPFRISLNGVSKHIRVLERAGLVGRRRDWREHLVSFNPAPLHAAAAWIDSTRKFWNDRLDALDAMLRSEVSPPPPASKASRKAARP